MNAITKLINDNDYLVNNFLPAWIYVSCLHPLDVALWSSLSTQTDICSVLCCSGCINGMVLVTDADCQAGRVEPCPPACSHLSSGSNCSAACIPGRTHAVWLDWTQYFESCCFTYIRTCIEGSVSGPTQCQSFANMTEMLIKAFSLLQGVAVLMVCTFRVDSVWTPASVCVCGTVTHCSLDRRSTRISVPPGQSGR